MIKDVLAKSQLHLDEYTYVAEPNFSVLLFCESDIVEIRNDVKANTFIFKNKFPFNDRLIDAHYYKVRRREEDEKCQNYSQTINILTN